MWVFQPRWVRQSAAIFPLLNGLVRCAFPFSAHLVSQDLIASLNRREFVSQNGHFMGLIFIALFVPPATSYHQRSYKPASSVKKGSKNHSLLYWLIDELLRQYTYDNTWAEAEDAQSQSSCGNAWWVPQSAQRRGDRVYVPPIPYPLQSSRRHSFHSTPPRTKQSTTIILSSTTWTTTTIHPGNIWKMNRYRKLLRQATECFLYLFNPLLYRSSQIRQSGVLCDAGYARKNRYKYQNWS